MNTSKNAMIAICLTAILAFLRSPALLRCPLFVFPLLKSDLTRHGPGEERFADGGCCLRNRHLASGNW